MGGGHNRLARARSILLRILLIEVLVLVVTGIALFFVYRPPIGQSWLGLDTPHETLGIRIANVVRALHALTSWFLVLTALAAAVTLTLQRQAPVAVGIAVAALVTSFTGFLLPWDQLALRAVKVGMHIEGYTFLFGSSVRFVLAHGTEITSRTLAVWLVVHVLVLGPALTGLVVLAWRRPEIRPRTGGRH